MKYILIFFFLGLTACQSGQPSTPSEAVPAQRVNQKQTQTNMKILYFFDPLCGWCYGFSPVIERLAKEYAGKIEIEPVSGGMITGSRIGPIGQVAPYISKAYKDVENATGVKFGEAFLNGTLKKGTAVFTSIPASVALAVVKTEKPDRALAFCSELHKAIYYDGAAPADPESFLPYAEKYGFSRETFLNKMKDPTFLQKAEADFTRSHSMGVQGFPMLFLMKGDSAYQIGYGYQSYSELEGKLKSKL